ncbi:MAG: ethanolamine permease, partial [Bacteroidota bacterium]|nr:ethanolamine permease [Bacteroidota bacterium]
NALLINMAVGVIAMCFISTDDLIRISGFGALTLYIVAMVSLLVLRRKEPNLERPFKVPLYPVFPVLALVIALFSIIVMAYYNARLALIYFGFLILAYAVFKIAKTFPMPVQTK